MTYPKNSDTVSDEVNAVAAGELRQFIERIEFIEGEIKDSNADKADIYGEAKGRGYDVKAIKQLIRERRRDRDEMLEEEAILETYRQALGMRTAS